MARTKQATPLRREPSSEYYSKADAPGTPTRSPRNMNKEMNGTNGYTNGHANGTFKKAPVPVAPKERTIWHLIFAVGGIYTSFITWAILQERLTTTPYGDPDNLEVFNFPVFLNTVQSTFAACTGYLYLLWDKKDSKPAPIFPSRRIVGPLLLVAFTSSLASPFGYASLSHLDYITFILAKSCKLLPVMFLHITLFQKRYPLYKYLVVMAVTTGVAVFTLHAGKKSSKPSAAAINPDRNTAWGLLLLGINLLFDGLTNTTQDWIFTTLKPYSGPQMMCANNILSTILQFSYLTLSPYLVHTPLGEYLGMTNGGGQFTAALGFLARHPGVWFDVLGFAACGAIGQVFIFYALQAYGSLLLVTVTVTRKMLTMILSVIWFGHKLRGKQWAGVSLVFSGIGAEAYIGKKEKEAKLKEKNEKEVKEL